MLYLKVYVIDAYKERAVYIPRLDRPWPAKWNFLKLFEWPEISAAIKKPENTGKQNVMRVAFKGFLIT